MWDVENSWNLFCFGKWVLCSLFKCIHFNASSWARLLPTLNQCGLDGTDSHLVASWVPMNHFVLIRVNVKSFLELLEEDLSFLLAGPPMDSNRLSGKTLAQFSWGWYVFSIQKLCHLLLEKNEVSVIFEATEKNYIHKIWAVATASDQLLRLLKSFFSIKWI